MAEEKETNEEIDNKPILTEEVTEFKKEDVIEAEGNLPE